MTNGKQVEKSNNVVSSNFITSTPLTNNTTTTKNYNFDLTTSSSNNVVNNAPVFQVSANNVIDTGLTTTTSRPDSTISNSLFKIPTNSSTNNKNEGSIKRELKFKPLPVTTIFKIPSSNTKINNSKDEMKFNTEPVSSTSLSLNVPAHRFKEYRFEIDENEDDNTLTLYDSIKNLNESVLEWITGHVKESPVCILTPIFNDYAKHLDDILNTYSRNRSNQGQINTLNVTSINPSANQVKDLTSNTVKSLSKVPNLEAQDNVIISDTKNSKGTSNIAENPFCGNSITTSKSATPLFTFSEQKTSSSTPKLISSTNSPQNSIFSIKNTTDNVPTFASSEQSKSNIQSNGIKSTSSAMPTTTFLFTPKNTNTNDDKNENLANVEPSSNLIFGQKNTSTTNASIFSLKNKTETSTDSDAAAIVPQQFSFGVKTSTTAPLFSFTNKGLTTNNSNIVDTTISQSTNSSNALFQNTNVTLNKNANKDVLNTGQTDKFSFGNKNSVSSSTTNPTFSFTNKTPTTINNSDTNVGPVVKSPPNFTFGIKSTLSSTTTTPTFTTGLPDKFSFAAKGSLPSTVASPTFSFNNSGNSESKSESNTDTSTVKSPQTFTFGIKNTLPSTTVPTFTFSSNTSSTSNATSIFNTVSSPEKPAITSNESTISNKSLFSTPTTTSTLLNTKTDTPFSFGAIKPFSFNSSLSSNSEIKNSNDNTEENEEPPKVEYTPIIEENSIYEKKCKIFVKKDDNFVDRGVGTLYIKKIEDKAKHQLLVRANTNLGTILVNLILTEAIPCQRMGKNNVMMVCIPTPESKPPPVPLLIRVKTSEEADELLDQLTKCKN